VTAGYNSGYYAQQASDAQYRANTDLANNAYGRFLSQQRGSRSLGDMSQRFGRQLPGFKSSYTQRGMAGPGIQSGVYNRSLSNYLGDYNRDYSRLQQDTQQEAQNYDLQSAQVNAYLNSSLANIEQSKQNDIANAALMLEALRPYLGGL
jgi:hypothetical protein